MEILHKVLSVFDHHLVVPDTSLHQRVHLLPTTSRTDTMTSTSNTSIQKRSDILKQMAEFQKTGNAMRLQSPLLQQWPWDNGMPLQHGLMGERMRQLLSTSDHEPVFVAMVLVSESVQVSCPTYLSPPPTEIHRCSRQF